MTSLRVNSYAQYLDYTRAVPDKSSASRILAQRVAEQGEEQIMALMKSPPTRCQVHPGKMLDLYCKVHKEAICSICPREHANCHDEYRAEHRVDEEGLEELTPFQAIEVAAEELSGKVLFALAEKVGSKEHELRDGASHISGLRKQVSQQLTEFTKEVEEDRDRLVQEANRRCVQHVVALKEAAKRKDDALEKQESLLTSQADVLARHQNTAIRAVTNAKRNHGPLEVVTLCLKLMEQMEEDMTKEVEVEPVEKPDLHIKVPARDGLSEGIQNRGWIGPIEVDVAHCTLAAPSKMFLSGKSMPAVLRLTTRDSDDDKINVPQGQMVVKARQLLSDGFHGPEVRVRVENKSEGEYDIIFRVLEEMVGRTVEVDVLISGRVVRDTPKHIQIRRDETTAANRGLLGLPRRSLSFTNMMSFRSNSDLKKATVENIGSTESSDADEGSSADFVSEHSFNVSEDSRPRRSLSERFLSSLPLADVLGRPSSVARAPRPSPRLAGQYVRRNPQALSEAAPVTVADEIPPTMDDDVEDVALDIEATEVVTPKSAVDGGEEELVESQ